MRSLGSIRGLEIFVKFALSAAPCAQVPTITRPVGVQRILPAMVCVQVELSRWMERAQVRSTGFHVPLMANGTREGPGVVRGRERGPRQFSVDLALCIESYSPAERGQGAQPHCPLLYKVATCDVRTIRDFQQDRTCYVITVYLRRNEDRISTADRICTLRFQVLTA